MDHDLLNANNLMKRFFIALTRWKRAALLLLLTLVVVAGSQPARAQLLMPGDTTTNLTFIARRAFTRPDGTMVAAGSQVGIHDLAGRVLFLEWFAVWCPFCQAAVQQVTPGIHDWYETRGGNPYGVPVLYLFVNQESASFYQAQTDAYINQYIATNTPVFNDYGPFGTNVVRFQFQSSGQPTFVAINALTNSPTHQPWEVLVNHSGYGQTDFNQELAAFRAIIDTVQPGVTPPVIADAQRAGADFQFSFHAEANRTYRVEGTTNLVNYTTLWTVQGSNAPVQFTHTNAPPSGQLYRVATP